VTLHGTHGSHRATIRPYVAATCVPAYVCTVYILTLDGVEDETYYLDATWAQEAAEDRIGAKMEWREER